MKAIPAEINCQLFLHIIPITVSRSTASASEMHSDRKQGMVNNIATLSKVGDFFIACLGTLQSCLAQNFRIELTLSKGVTVTKTFGPTSNTPLTINVGGFSSVTERDFILISKIENLSSEVEEAVLIETKISRSKARSFLKTQCWLSIWFLTLR